MKKKKIFFSITIFLFCLTVFVSCKKDEKTTEITQSAETVAIDPLPSWNEGPHKKAIIEYVKDVTADSSASFIPESDRIAVFDNDGTLWPEQPYPNQLQFCFDYIKNNPDKVQLSSDLKQAVLKDDLETLKKNGLKGLLEIANAAHGNIKAEDFDNNVRKWLDTTKHKKFDMPYDKAVYKPMLELLDYLRANGFKTFIVSGGGADFMRVFSENTYGIPTDQVVGTYGETKYDKASGELTKTGKIVMIDDKEGKPAAIRTFIGKRPVVCFGNSDGDQAMMEYTSGNTLPTLCGIVHHTDEVREFAYDSLTHSGTLKTAFKAAKEKNWLLIDMKQDWNKVFDK